MPPWRKPLHPEKKLSAYFTIVLEENTRAKFYRFLGLDGRQIGRAKEGDSTTSSG